MVGVGVGGVVVVIRNVVVMAVARFVVMGPGVLPRRQGHAILLAGSGAFPLAEGAALHQAFHVVVVAVLGRSHLGFEPQHLGAVLAKGAVHVRIAPQHVLHPIPEGSQHLGMVPQVGGLQDLQLGMVVGHPLAVLHDPADQHAGEEEIGEHHDAAIAQLHHVAQAWFDQGEGDTGVNGFAPGEAEALHKQSRHLGHVAVGVGIGGTAAHHHQQGLLDGHGLPAGRPVLFLRLIQAGANAGPCGLDHATVDPELAAVVDAQTRFSGVGVQHGGNVVLGMPRREQHRRYGQHMAHPPPAQGIEAIAQDRPGKLQISVFHGHLAHGVLQLAGQGGEFFHRQPVATAVAADQHPNRTMGPLERSIAALHRERTGWDRHGLQRLSTTLFRAPRPEYPDSAGAPRLQHWPRCTLFRVRMAATLGEP